MATPLFLVRLQYFILVQRHYLSFSRRLGTHFSACPIYALECLCLALHSCNTQVPYQESKCVWQCWQLIRHFVVKIPGHGQWNYAQCWEADQRFEIQRIPRSQSLPPNLGRGARLCQTPWPPAPGKAAAKWCSHSTGHPPDGEWARPHHRAVRLACTLFRSPRLPKDPDTQTRESACISFKEVSLPWISVKNVP